MHNFNGFWFYIDFLSLQILQTLCINYRKNWGLKPERQMILKRTWQDCWKTAQNLIKNICSATWNLITIFYKLNISFIRLLWGCLRRLYTQYFINVAPFLSILCFFSILCFLILTVILCKNSRKGSNQIVLIFLKGKLEHFRPNFMNLVPGAFEIQYILFM